MYIYQRLSAGILFLTLGDIKTKGANVLLATLHQHNRQHISLSSLHFFNDSIIFLLKIIPKACIYLGMNIYVCNL